MISFYGHYWDEAMTGKQWFFLLLFVVSAVVGVVIFQEYDDVYLNADLL